VFFNKKAALFVMQRPEAAVKLFIGLCLLFLLSLGWATVSYIWAGWRTPLSVSVPCYFTVSFASREADTANAEP